MLRVRSTIAVVTDNNGEKDVRDVPSYRRCRRDWMEVIRDVARRIFPTLVILSSSRSSSVGKGRSKATIILSKFLCLHGPLIAIPHTRSRYDLSAEIKRSCVLAFQATLL
jgi:hypothetical protein